MLLLMLFIFFHAVVHVVVDVVVDVVQAVVDAVVVRVVCASLITQTTAFAPQWNRLLHSTSKTASLTPFTSPSSMVSMSLVALVRSIIPLFLFSLFFKSFYVSAFFVFEIFNFLLIKHQL